MKKNTLLIMLLAPLLLVGCGTTNTDTTSSSKASSVSEQPDGIKYSATVKLPDATPAVGAKVKWCTDETCLPPVSVDANGYAEIYVETAIEYHVQPISFDSTLYSVNPNGHLATPTNRDVEITLTGVVGSIDDTVNTESNPLAATATGAYKAKISAAEQSAYLTFTPSEARQYSIESWEADDNTELSIAYKGAESIPAEGQSTGVKGNFKYEFTAEASKSYTFEIKLKQNPYKTAYKFDFAII